MNAAKKAIRALEKLLSSIGVVLLLSMMFIGARDVIGRYIFNRPMIGAMELNNLLMGATVFLLWAPTQFTKGHVTVDIFFRRYNHRLKAFFTVIMLLLMVGLFGLMAWRSMETAINDWQAGKLVQVVLIPLFPFKMLVTVGATTMCLECLVQLADLAPTIFGGGKNKSCHQ